MCWYLKNLINWKGSFYMATEWKSGCKKCGKEFSYSDRGYKDDQKKGFTRPEYCPEHQKEQVKMRADSGMSYITVKPNSYFEECGFGKLTHPGMNHEKFERDEDLHPERYGLTPAKIKELAEFFMDSRHRVAIVTGPTGSGKSTLLPYWMMYPPKETGLPFDFFTRDGQMIHTQPRITAAVGQVNHVAGIGGLNVGVGGDIGERDHDHQNSDRHNLWVSVTDGTFINYINSGRLSEFGYVLVDEAHERSMNIDTILRLLKEKLDVYPRLKVIVLSATINEKEFLDFFGENISKIIEFEGKTREDQFGKPVSYERLFWQEKELPYDDLDKLSKKVVNIVVAKSVEIAEKAIDGSEEIYQKIGKTDILVFLPGKRLIEEACEKTRKAVSLKNNLRNIIEVYPLYSDLEDEEKDKVLHHDLRNGKINIIFSTNVAEASVTIDSLGYEVETGLEYQSVYNRMTGKTNLPLTLISKANAKQRWGRTGRNRNGLVFCIYSENQFVEIFPEYPIPAIKRSSMDDTVLNMKISGVVDFKRGWLKNPDLDVMIDSFQNLKKIGAIQDSLYVTSRGMILKNFAYPLPIIDMLMEADSLGILAEVARLLPVIKNGGNRRILEWDYEWDAYKKREVYNLHASLMMGCRDDIDFVLKVIDGYLSGGEKFVVENYINLGAMQEITKESEEIFERFYEDKESEIRDICMEKIPLIRKFLKDSFPENDFWDDGQEYVFDPKMKTDKKLYLVCKLTETGKAFEGKIVDLNLFVNNGKCEIGDNVFMYVVEKWSYPGDSDVYFLLEDKVNGLMAIVGSESLIFSKLLSVLVAKFIPIDALLKMKLEKINRLGLVYMTFLPEFQSRMSEISKKYNGVRQSFKTEIVGVDSEKVSVLPEWADVQMGFVPLMSFSVEDLSKSLDLYKVGDELRTFFSVNERSSTVNLEFITVDLENIEKISYEVDNQKLIYKGKMSEVERKKLINISDDEDYRLAIDRLYWLSNRVFAKEFVNLQEKFNIGDVVEAEILSKNKGGFNLRVDSKFKGFLPNRFAGGYNQEGSTIKCQIREIKDNEIVLMQI